METWTCNEGFRQYLILKNDFVDFDSFEMKMLTHYEGEGLLPHALRHQDGLTNICYETSGGIPLQQSLATRELDKKQLILLYSCVWKCYEELEEYLLVPDGILLSPDVIFYFPAKQTFGFCFSPEVKHSFREELLCLTEFCMKHTCHQEEAAVIFIYDMYHMLQKSSIEEKEIKKYILQAPEVKDERTVKEIQVTEPQEQGQESRTVQFSREETETDKNSLPFPFYIYGGLTILAGLLEALFAIRFLFVTHRESDLKLCIILCVVIGLLIYSLVRVRREVQMKREYRLANTGSEQVLTVEQSPRIAHEIPGEPVKIQKTELLQQSGESSETVVLGIPDHIDSALWELEEQRGTRTSIQLNRLPGVIGRKFSEVDYVISEDGVSRRHALLLLSEDVLYVEDLASTNGTYINGVRLRSGEPMPLADGDILAIGPCTYRVRKK